MKIGKWFGVLLAVAFGIAIITTFLGTGKNFSTFLSYINRLELYNPFEQTMKSAKDFIDNFKNIRFDWSSNPFKLVLNLLNYQFKLIRNLFDLITLPIRFGYYVILDLYYMLQAVYDFIR